LAIPRAKDRVLPRCPVDALMQWIRAAKLWQDSDGERITRPVFRRISKAGNVHANAFTYDILLCARVRKDRQHTRHWTRSPRQVVVDISDGTKQGHTLLGFKMQMRVLESPLALKYLNVAE
jgi:hypothetical protein